MTVALLDSNVLIAYASARDQYHEAGAAIVRGFDHGNFPDGIVVEYVLAETLNFVHERLGHSTALDLHDRLKRGDGFDLVRVTNEDYYRADDLFQRYDGLSFVDASIAAYMRRTEIEYLYSFDDDFNAVETLTRLDSAVNPYA
ncbi:MAG: type II toxin-antitoxin system VapC family toxin [Halorientalis sp.]